MIPVRENSEVVMKFTVSSSSFRVAPALGPLTFSPRHTEARACAHVKRTVIIPFLHGIPENTWHIPSHLHFLIYMYIDQ